MNSISTASKSPAYVQATKMISRGASRFGASLLGLPPMSSQERFMRESLAQAIAEFGPDHPHVGIRLLNLAEILRDHERDTEAQALEDQAKGVLKGIFETDGSQH